MHELAHEISADLSRKSVEVCEVNKYTSILRFFFRKEVVVLFPAPNPTNIFFVLLSFIGRRRYYFGIHDVRAHDKKEVLKVYLYNFLISKLAYGVITFSKFSAKECLSVFNRKSLIYYFKMCREFETAPKKNDVLVFGRFLHYQGGDRIRKVALQCPELKFLVVGAQAPENLESLPNVEVERRFVEQEKLEEHISSSKVVLLPYRSATQSGHIPLVFSKGTHVVGFDVGALSDVWNVKTVHC